MIYQFPQLAMKNRQIVQQSTNAGCFKCLKIFSTKEINQYTDGEQTVLCPYCQTDSVVGDMCGFKLTEDILKTAHDFWYVKK